MRRYLIPLAFVMLAAACGPAPATDSPDAPTPEPPRALPAGGLFAYAYEPGSSYTYSFQLNETMQISFDAEGDPALFATEEAPPEEVDAEISVAGTVTYDVAPGPEPDTYEITVTGSFDDISVTGTVDGEPIEEGMDLSEMGAPDLVQVPNLRIVIDSQGNIIEGEVDGEELPDFDLFDDPFSSFEDVTSGGLNSHFGPPFPEGPLQVGDSWSESISKDVFDQTFTAESSYAVTGVEEIDGAEVAVIEAQSSFSGLTIDLGQFLLALFEGFAELGEEAQAEADPFSQLDFTFLISLAPSDAQGTVWFDPVAGISRRFEQDTSVAMTMDFAMDDGNQAGSMQMEMSFGISVQAQLEA